MKSCTVQIVRITVRMLKIMASIRVNRMSCWPGSEYFGLFSAMSKHIMNAVRLNEIVRKSLEHFFVCADLT